MLQVVDDRYQQYLSAPFLLIPCPSAALLWFWRILYSETASADAEQDSLIMFNPRPWYSSRGKINPPPKLLWSFSLLGMLYTYLLLSYEWRAFVHFPYFTTPWIPGKNPLVWLELALGYHGMRSTWEWSSCSFLSTVSRQVSALSRLFPWPLFDSAGYCWFRSTFGALLGRHHCRLHSLCGCSNWLWMRCSPLAPF